MFPDIRIIDFFESVMEYPHLYTIRGSYQEAVTFMEGCMTSYDKIPRDDKILSHYFFKDVELYIDFKEWLAEKFKIQSKEVLRSFDISMSDEEAFTLILQLYREFKKSASSHQTS